MWCRKKLRGSNKVLRNLLVLWPPHGMLSALLIWFCIFNPQRLHQHTHTEVPLLVMLTFLAWESLKDTVQRQYQNIFFVKKFSRKLTPLSPHRVLNNFKSLFFSLSLFFSFLMELYIVKDCLFVHVFIRLLLCHLNLPCITFLSQNKLP